MKTITIYSALLAAKKNFKKVVFDKQGARNKYATYGAIKDAVEDALADQDIDMIFETGWLEGCGDYIRLTLVHAPSDTRHSGSQRLFMDDNSPIKDTNQRYGAAVTYGMRNLARTLLGLHAEDGDLDNYDQSTTPASSRTITDKQLALLHKIIPEPKQTVILKHYNIPTLADLTLDQASDIIKRFKKD